jgi:hypothetical protein
MIIAQAHCIALERFSTKSQLGEIVSGLSPIRHLLFLKNTFRVRRHRGLIRFLIE